MCLSHNLWDLATTFAVLRKLDIFVFWVLIFAVFHIKNTPLFQVSSSLPLDILKFDSKQKQVIVRVPSNNYAKVRAALTVCSSMHIAGVDVPVIYSVRQASSCLLSLAGPERTIVWWNNLKIVLLLTIFVYTFIQRRSSQWYLPEHINISCLWKLCQIRQCWKQIDKEKNIQPERTLKARLC